MRSTPSPNTSSRLGDFFSLIEPLEARIAPAQIIVTTLKDITTPAHDSGSLRDAILLANASTGVADVIVFQKADGKPLTGSIKLATDLPLISDPLTITGPVPGKSSSLAIDGAKHAIFNILNAGAVTMTDLTVKNGLAPVGGGILIDNLGFTVALTDLTITGNKAISTVFGAAAAGGGVAINNGTVTISKSKISGNVSAGIAGDAFNPGGNAYAGGIFCKGTLTLIDSTVSGNVAQGGKALPVSSGFTGGTGSGGGIVGKGATSKLTIQNSIISGNKAIGGDASAGAKGGDPGGNGGTAYGGGVYNSLGTVEITGSIISGNSVKGGKAGKGGAGDAGHDGGDGGYGGNTAGGGILTDGTTTIGTSIISGNKVTPGAGGAGGSKGPGTYAGVSYGPGSTQGGGISSGGGTFNISQCSVTGNSAGRGGGFAGGDATIEASTFSKNKASGEGGGILFYGGTLIVKNSTVAANSAGTSGGGFTITGGTVKIHNSTIAQNTAKVFGGGLGVIGGVVPVDIISTIIAGNKAKEDADLSATGFAVLASFSLIQKDTPGTVFDPASHDNLTDIDPLLSTLKDNGGILLRDGKRILTIAVKAGSPVIDKGNNPDALTTDQRGTGFDRTKGVGTDIGAIEIS